MDTYFKWPCYKREAHGSHPIRVSIGEDQVCSYKTDCPGVKAHPNTMIGRQG